MEFCAEHHFIVFADSASGGPADSSIIDITIEQSSYSVYEYVTGERWRVEMVLPSMSPALLPPGRHWIVVQPSCVYYDNGQTGIIAEVGCGNGYEVWCRFYAITNIWRPATYYFGAPYEIGLILIGQPVIAVEEHDSKLGRKHTFGFMHDLPNPVSGRTSISYVTTEPGLVSPKMYNTAGQEVETLINADQAAGRHAVVWEADHLPPGAYFLQLESGQESVILKTILIQ